MQEQGPIVIELERVEDLFEAASFAPLQGHFEPRTGMEQVLDQVAVRRLHPREQLRLGLVIRSPSELTDAEIETAVRGYCEAVVADRRLDAQRVRRLGRNTLLLGLGFLATCMVLSTAVSTAAFLPEFVRRLFGEGLVIAGWVGLWRPVEVLLFDTRPPQRDIRLHRAIGAAEIDIRRSA